MVLLYRGARAYVKASGVEKKIVIRVLGESAAVSNLMAVIRYELDDINSKLHKVEISGNIPCNCTPECTYLFTVEYLRRAHEKKKPAHCQISLEDVNASKLLHNYPSVRDDRQSGREIHVHGIYVENMTGEEIVMGDKNINFPLLAGELARLLEAVQKRPNAAQHQKEIAALQEAKVEADRVPAGGGKAASPKLWIALRETGKFCYDVAKDIGTDIAAEIIKKSIGM